MRNRPEICNFFLSVTDGVFAQKVQRSPDLIHLAVTLNKLHLCCTSVLNFKLTECFFVNYIDKTRYLLALGSKHDVY